MLLYIYIHTTNDILQTLAVPNQTRKADESERRATTANEGQQNSSGVLGGSRCDMSRAQGMLFF